MDVLPRPVSVQLREVQVPAGELIVEHMQKCVDTCVGL